MKNILLLLFLVLSILIVSCSKNTDDEVLPEINFDELQSDTDASDSSATVEHTQTEETQAEASGEEEEEESLENSEEEKPLVPSEESIDIPEEEPAVVTPEYVAVTDIKLSMTDVSLYIGAKSMPIVTMYPQNASDKGEVWVSSDESIATVDSIGNIKGVTEGKCQVTVTSTDNSDVFATVNVTVKANAECTYIDGILIVNKTYALPPDYAPGWETEATPHLWEMIEAAKADGITLWMKSGYRSYYDQQYIYNNYVARDGQEEADTYSARPGHSEHQTGLAYDLNNVSQDFGDTPEGKWVAENCYKYGFILRYPKDKEHITGYIYEPWHVRYIGVEKATEVYESGLCLEEFLGITSVYS